MCVCVCAIPHFGVNQKDKWTQSAVWLIEASDLHKEPIWAKVNNAGENRQYVLSISEVCYIFKFDEEGWLLFKT